MKTAQFTLLVLICLVSTALAVSENYNVSWEGTLKAVHHGDVSGKVSLQEFSAKKNLYAVGPVAELDGEITVIDSNSQHSHKPWCQENRQWCGHRRRCVRKLFGPAGSAIRGTAPRYLLLPR